MTNISAVVFDMDGVLIEARDWHFEALNEALALFGYSISRYEHLATYDGLPTRRKLEILSLERGLPPALHSFINQMKQEYTHRLIVTQCRPVFQHEYALSRLRARGYRLALASNSVRSTVDLMMGASRLAGYMDVTLSNEDVEHAKPAPDIYRIAAQRLELAPEELLVVEDNDNGITAARAAGCHVLAVAGPHDVRYERILSRIEAIEQQVTR